MIARLEPGGERLPGDPEGRGGQEDHQHHPLLALHAPELRDLRAQHASPGLGARGVAPADPPEGEPDHRQEEQHEGNPDRHVLEEGDLDPALRHEARELRVRRGADLGPDPAHVRGVGDREHHRGAVVLETPAAGVRLQLGDHREPDRQHHGRGRGVRDPERDEGGGGEHPEEQPARIGPDRAHDRERDAPVQVPLLHRRGDAHAAQEQEDVGVEVRQHHAPRVLQRLAARRRR